jgi:Na+/H+-dicarboxylate symporter
MNIRLALHWQIFIAIVLAALAGYLGGRELTLLGVPAYEAYDFLGTLFLNALKMIIVPLVVSTIITGIGGIGSEAGFGRLGAKTILFYAFTSLSAIVTGLVLVNLTMPGFAGGGSFALEHDGEELSQALAAVEGRGARDIVDIFVRMVPSNVVAAAVEGDMLGLIFFSLLFGFFMMRIGNGNAELIRRFWQAVADTMMAITMWVMKFAPLGVFGLVAKTVADTGFAAFQPLLLFFVTVLLALGFHAFVTLPLLVKFVGRVSPARFYRGVAPAMLTAFSTASSSATLPLSMECVEKNVGVSNRVSSFVLPLGATVNMDGTALYECVAAMFIAQAYGIHLDFTAQFTIVLLALMTSIGVAGIPAASLVAISIILGAVGLPLEGIGLLLVTDRILDMLRTSVNVLGDCSGAVVLAALEGEPARPPEAGAPSQPHVV